MQALGDLVCTELRTGARVPLLGYTPVTTDTNGAALEAALHAGYRQLVLDADASMDLMVGTVIKLWYQDGKINRDDIFVAVKIDIKSINRIQTKVTKRIHDLNCGYIDCLILSKCEDITDVAHLQRAWQSFENMLDVGHTRSLGITGLLPHTLDKLVAAARILPVLYLADAALLDNKPLWAKLVALQKYTKSKQIQLLLSLDWDSIRNELLMNEGVFQSIVSRCRRAPCQILTRYFRQRGLIVICKSGDSTILQDSFRVYDFLLQPHENVTISKLLIGMS